MSFSVVETEYHPLPRSPGTGRTHSSTGIISVLPSKKSSTRSSPAMARSTVLFRISAFIFVEGAFITLAAYVMSTPIPLPAAFTHSLTEAKGGLTILSIIWHALAVFTVRDIVLHIFSGEWMERARCSGEIVLEESDIVSRITTGYIDQIQHFMSRQTGSPFRLGFISALLLVALNGLGPSALTVDTTLLARPKTIKVANLTLMDGTFDPNADPSIMLARDRANIITRLELLENSTYSFRSKDHNVLIPWPSPDLILTSEMIKYETDVITYNFSCSWHRPSLQSGHGTNRYWSINNQTFVILDQPEIAINENASVTEPAILPLIDNSNSLRPATARIGFLFVGYNSTQGGFITLNLDTLPTSINGISLYSALVCDPQFRIQAATVTSSNGTLWSDIHTGLPTVNNVPVSAANTIFAQSLIFATSTRDHYGGFPRPGDAMHNNIVRTLFLTDPSFPFIDPSHGVKPLPIDKITQNMNAVLQSSAKAYLSGYRVNSSYTTFPTFEMIDTKAVGQIERLALMGSRPFTIALAILVVVLVILLVTIFFVVRVDRLYPFDLKHIVETLGVQHDQR